MGRAVWAVVVVGTILPGAVAHLAVAAAPQAAVISIWVFAWFSPSNDFSFRPKLMR